MKVNQILDKIRELKRKYSTKQLKTRRKLVPNDQQITVRQLRKWLKQNCTGEELVEKNAYVPCEDCHPTEHEEVSKLGFTEKVTQNHLDLINDVLRIH